jgi:hypothetical protein
MTEPPEHEPSAAPAADPTRDIRLPPLPGRPAPVLPAAWARPPGDPAGEAPVPASLVDQPTDQWGPPGGVPRHQTLDLPCAMAPPHGAGGSTPGGPGAVSVVVTARRRRRRWPWVVVSLLPVLVIVVTGIWLLLLLRAA